MKNVAKAGDMKKMSEWGTQEFVPYTGSEPGYNRWLWGDGRWVDKEPQCFILDTIHEVEHEKVLYWRSSGIFYAEIFRGKVPGGYCLRFEGWGDSSEAAYQNADAVRKDICKTVLGQL